MIDRRLAVPVAGALVLCAFILFGGLQASSEESPPPAPLAESEAPDSGEVADASESQATAPIPDFKASADSPPHPIRDVTVYSDRAEISRQLELKLKPGMQWIHVGPLVHQLDKTSVKLKPLFSAPVKIGQVLMEESFERGGLPTELKQKADALRRLYGELLARTQRERSISLVSGFVHAIRLDEPFQRTGQRDFQPFTAKTDALQTSIEELARQSGSVSDELKREREAIRELGEKIELARNEIQRFTQLGEQKWVVHLYALVESGEAQKGKLRLSYQIPNAKWYPVYDLRAELNRETGTADIRLVTAGLVEQHTGEDWDGVGLALSTLDPVPLFLPRLTRWTLAESRQEAPPPPGKPSPMRARKQEYKEANEKADFGALAKVETQNKLREAAPAAAAPMEAIDQAFDSEEADVADKRTAASARGAGGGVGLSSSLARQNLAKDSSIVGSKGKADQASDFFPLTPLEQLYPQLGEVNRSIGSISPGATQTRLVTATAATAAPAQNSYGDSNLPAVQAGGRLIEFTSPFSVDLASDDPPYKIPVHSQALRGELTYFAIPKMDSRVYLRAETSNPTDRPILGGSAQVFMDGDLVSKTSLSTISEGSHFTVDLGVDRNVQTKRVVTKKSRETGIIRSKHVTDVEVKIELANHHPFPVAMEVRDHYPLVPNDQIQVELAKVSPQPEEKKHGLLRWKVKVGARQKSTLTFTYQVSHPESYLVSEFN